MQNLSWFESKIGSHILRGTNRIFIDSIQTANKLFYIQDVKKAYTFTEESSLDDFFAAEKPAIRIHKNLESCESCSA